MKLRTVLIVDDNASVRHLLTVMTRSQFECTVISVDGGEKAIEVFESIKDDVSVVLLDHRMLDMDGCDTMVALREIKPDVNIVLMSGYSEDQVLEECGDNAPKAFLSKPYTMDSIREAVLRAME